MLDVLEPRVDPDGVSKLRVLAPQDRFRVAEFGERVSRGALGVG